VLLDCSQYLGMSNVSPGRSRSQLPYHAQTRSWPIPVRGRKSGLTILELATGASGPTTRPSFSILKA
jgi:hypothetical protein